MRAEREHNSRAWLAWHIVALGRQKRLPDLDRLLAKSKKRGPPQTLEEQMKVMETWAAQVERAMSIRKGLQ